MKPHALTFLVCPSCRDELTLSATQEADGEIETGLLTCRGCATTYPITRGVPRFVASGEYASSFGFQWQRFRHTQLDSQNGSGISAAALRAATGWTAGDYRGQLVLDVGVGSGRFAEVVADAGGEVVGIDLTAAVEAAYSSIGRRPNVHIVQADVFRMPFRDGTFDRAFSIGVLHHTPDPERAFGRMVAAVRDGGGIAVYVYARYGPSHRFSDAIRRVTTRLPLPVMLAASTLAIPLYYVYSLPLVGGLLRIAAPISMHRDWRWRWLDTFDWYTPKYQFKYLYPEVFRWFRANGLEDIEIFDEPIRMRGTKPRVLSAAPTGPARDTHLAAV